jgi:hypothetical protein
MEAWFNELRDNSHRDQLSFNYVLWKNSDVNVIYMNKDICKSKWFYWNTIHKKAVEKPKDAPKERIEEIKKKIAEIRDRKKKMTTFNVNIY